MEERRPRKQKKNLFVREETVLNLARDSANDEKLTAEEKNEKFLQLCKSYEDLLDQTKLITKVSDRLQNKINTANAKLEDKNVELQSTIDALTKARVGRRATTYVLIIAVVLFIMTEAFIEPPIERWAMGHQDDWGGENAVLFVSLGLKGVLALMLKPIEMVVERYMMRRAQKQATATKSKPAVA